MAASMGAAGTGRGCRVAVARVLWIADVVGSACPAEALEKTGEATITTIADVHEAGPAVLPGDKFDIIIGDERGLPVIEIGTKVAPVFGIVYSAAAATNALRRYRCFKAGAHMVSNDADAVMDAVRLVMKEADIMADPCFPCPLCSKPHLPVAGLRAHMDRWHSALESAHAECPLCCKHVDNILGHLHKRHDDTGAKVREAERDMPPLKSTALVLVHRATDNAFLLVQEHGNRGFWLPAGGVDAGEEFQAAALREAREEAGVHVTLTGILRVEFTPLGSHTRMRVWFVGRVADTASIKTIPDYESAGTVWATVDDLQQLHAAGLLRGEELLPWAQYVASGGVSSPISVLTNWNTGIPKPSAS